MLTHEERLLQEAHAQKELEQKMQRGLVLMLEEVKARGIVEDEIVLDDSIPCEKCYQPEMKKSLGMVKLNVPFEHPQFGKWLECPNPLCPVAKEIRFKRTEKLMSFYGYMPKEYEGFSFRLWDEKIVGYLGTGKHLTRKAAEVFAWHVVNTGKAWSIGEALAQMPNVLGVKELEPNYNAPPKSNGENPEWFKRYELSYELDGKRHTEIQRDSIARGLVLAGDNGTGKTGLAVAAGHYLAEHGISTSMIHMPTLISRLQATISKDYEGQSKQDILATLHADVLILDECGRTTKERASDYVLDIFETEIITPRFNAQKPIIITTNLDYAALGEFYGKVAISRVRAMCHWIVMNGVDLRQRNYPVNS